MCLNRVEAPITKEGIGYKSVRKDDQGYYSYDCVSKRGFRYAPIREWMTDPNTEPIIANDGTEYEAGFNIMLTSDNTVCTDDHCGIDFIVGVELRGATAGQAEYSTYGASVVAKDMRIIQ